jgi:hypothetical protein
MRTTARRLLLIFVAIGFMIAAAYLLLFRVTLTD